MSFIYTNDDSTTDRPDRFRISRGREGSRLPRGFADTARARNTTQVHNTHAAAYYTYTTDTAASPPSFFAAVLLLFWTCSKERRTSREVSR